MLNLKDSLDAASKPSLSWWRNRPRKRNDWGKDVKAGLLTLRWYCELSHPWLPWVKGQNSTWSISKSLYLPSLLLVRGSVILGLRLDHNAFFKIPPWDCCDDCVRKFLEMRVEKMFLFTLPWVRDTVTITQVVPGRLSTTFVFKRLYILKISLISGLFPHWHPQARAVSSSKMWIIRQNAKLSRD